MKIFKLLLISFLLPAAMSEASATTYTLPANGTDSVITQFDDNVPLTRAEQDETLLDVARRFRLGQTEIVRLNPEVDRWLVKKGEIIRLPNRRISPDTPRD
ncbi:MAG: LysM peptidoglycan-binding domain-containing protein, partial [Gammaproteobacteria bacterium]